ncbi:hypothetical protein GCM10009583_31090 [Ornithinicoccus hortensis]
MSANVPASKKKTASTTKSARGTILATVTTALIAAASWTPRRISRKKPQTAAADTRKATQVSPVPSSGSRSGNSWDRVDMIRTQ